MDDALARTGTARGQREYTLPTVRAFAHMPTALDHGVQKPRPGSKYTGQSNNGSTRFASSISGRSRLIPGLEKTSLIVRMR